MKATYKTVGLLAGAALLLAMGVAITFWSFSQIGKTIQERKHTVLVLSKANDLLSALKDAETGQRGYLLTGDEAFLEPYLAVRDSIGDRLKELRQPTSVSPAQVRLDAIAPLIQAKLAELSYSIELHRNHKFIAAVAGVSSGQGKHLMDLIRANISSFNQIEEGMLAQREAELQSNLRRLFAIIVIASLLALLFTLLFVYFIYHQTQQRLKNLVHLETQHLLDMQKETNRQLQQTNVTLQFSQEKLRISDLALKAISQGVLITNADGQILSANSAFSSITGFSSQEILGQTCNFVHGPLTDQQVLASIRLALKNATEFSGDILNYRKDGTAFWNELTISPVCNEKDQLTHFIGIIRDITARKRVAQLLDESLVQLHRLSDHQQNIKEDERKRIAQDIHDDLGQNLLVLKMDVTALYAHAENTHSKLNNRVSLVLNNIDATIQSVKSIMNDLRPPTLELGLYSAVEWQLKQFERISGIACTLVAIPRQAGLGLDQGRTLAIFRILQESLTNVARHAQATAVEVTFSQDQRGFSMKVKDNGKGLQPGDRRKANSFGLMGIQERIYALGGEFTIASSQDNGMVLSIFIAAEESSIEA